MSRCKWSSRSRAATGSRWPNWPTRRARACATTRSTWPICARCLTSRRRHERRTAARRRSYRSRRRRYSSARCMCQWVARAADIDGATLSLLWGLPFAGILLSIALLPLLAPIFWHHHFGKVAAAWALAFLLPFALCFGPAAAGTSLVHAALAEYIPFVLLLTALFTVA